MRLETQQNIKRGDLVRLGVVMFLWALCFPLITVGLRMAPPLMLAALRSFVAGTALLLPAFVWKNETPAPWGSTLLNRGWGADSGTMSFRAPLGARNPDEHLNHKDSSSLHSSE